VNPAVLIVIAALLVPLAGLFAAADAALNSVSRARVSAASVSRVIRAFVAAIHVSIAAIHSSTASLELTKLSALTGSKVTFAGSATAVPPPAVRKRSIHPGATIPLRFTSQRYDSVEISPTAFGGLTRVMVAMGE